MNSRHSVKVQRGGRAQVQGRWHALTVRTALAHMAITCWVGVGGGGAVSPACPRQGIQHRPSR